MIRGFGSIYLRLDLGDADGDAIADVLSSDALYLSSSGKNARSRSFDSTDADRHFRGDDGFSAFLGPLNDSSGVTSMIGTFRREELHAFSGSVFGPDLAYEGFYRTTSSAVWYANVSPVGDVNGDGWSDALFSSLAYPGAWDWGIAVIISGGRYIPRDSLLVSSITPEPQSRLAIGLTSRPIPVDDELRVEWRYPNGDPTSLRVYSATGAYMGFEVPAGLDGSAVLRVGHLASGLYIVVALDSGGRLIHSSSFIKH